MAITYKKGRKLTTNENCFDKSFVEITNPSKMIDGDTHAKLEHFPTKKEAVSFCKDNKIDFARVLKVESRFEFTWIVDLGRNCFMPRYAIGHLAMSAFGYKLGGVE